MQYRLLPTPDSEFQMPNGAWVFPVATLANELGGKLHITSEDRCYTLVVQRNNGDVYGTQYWPDAAVASLKNLPAPSDAHRRLASLCRTGT